jgi:hypothetical protein
MSEVTEKNIGMVKADLQRRLEGLISDGKKAKASLSELQTQDERARLEFERRKSDARRHYRPNWTG